MADTNRANEAAVRTCLAFLIMSYHRFPLIYFDALRRKLPDDDDDVALQVLRRLEELGAITRRTDSSSFDINLRQCEDCLSRHHRVEPTGIDDADPATLSPHEAAQAARDKWLYDQRMDGNTWKTVFDLQDSGTWESNWQRIGKTAVISAVKRYAQKSELPLPSGRAGRPAQGAK